jgi:protein phosphatase
LISAHVGDSRLYVIDKENKIHLKSKDHSLVKRLVELGEISESEVQQHPQRNVLYKAMGQDDPFEPDIDYFSIKSGEAFLICSDGLWGVLNEEIFLEIIKKDDDFSEIPCQLVSAANELGGPDNISVILVERLI